MNCRQNSQPNIQKAKIKRDCKKIKGKTNRKERLELQKPQAITHHIQKAFICKSTRGRIEQKEWSLQDETKLYELHDKIGNRWTTIAKQFTSRTDNDVKNHLFSRYRLSIRRLNRIICAHPTFRLNELKMSIISKIITTCESRFNSSIKVCSDLLTFSLRLKKEIIKFLYQHHTNNLSENVSKLIKNLHKFSTLLVGFKKANKKSTSEVQDDQNNARFMNNSQVKEEEQMEILIYQPPTQNDENFSQSDQIICFKQFFNDEIHQIPNIPFRIYLPEQNGELQNVDQNQNLKSPILIGTDPFSYQSQVQTILPPFLSLDEAYNYDKQENSDYQYNNYFENQ